MQFSLLIYIVVIFAVMYFLMIRPQQKRAKQHRELINNIQSGGKRSTTIGGIKGTVKAVDETTVVITVNGHGTELTFEKPAIKQVDPS
ncbi:preprotein translocase subunit YajC [Staphylococcus aureus]